MLASQHHYFFSEPLGPTELNIAHCLESLGISFRVGGSIKDHNLRLDEAACQWLEYKHLLATLCHQYCPNVMPETFLLDEIRLPYLLDQFKKTPEFDQRGPWILKPGLLNNGDGIRIIVNSDALHQHYRSSQRFLGPHVLQQYICPPHLLREHKYSIRMFVVITNTSGVFLYRQGYFNIARCVYRPSDWSSLDGHLTNEHLPSVSGRQHHQIPSTCHPCFDQVYPGLRSIVRAVIEAFRQIQPALFSSSSRVPALGLFGFDFMIDDALRPWLLEVNHGPCVPTDPAHPLQALLYQPFWHRLVTSILLPLIQSVPGCLSVNPRDWDAL